LLNKREQCAALNLKAAYYIPVIKKKIMAELLVSKVVLCRILVSQDTTEKFHTAFLVSHVIALFMLQNVSAVL